MKKFINKPEDIAGELTQGLIKAYSDYLSLVDNDIIVRARPKQKGKVQIVSSQGIGHEPAFNGMVGYGMQDVVVSGNIFASPGATRILAGLKVAWERGGGAPVLLIIGNHEGDVLNGNMAVEWATDQGMKVQSVVLYDDIASAPKGQEQNRRGMAGMIFGAKIAGALSEQGAGITEIIETLKRTNDATRTLLVAMSSCTLPTTGQVLFTIAEDEFIIGPGQHGEPGPEGPSKIVSANEVIQDVAERLINDGEYMHGDELLIIINGCGSTTLMEMFILYNGLEALLSSKGLKPYKPLIDNFVTTQEMAGFQLTMCKADDQIKKLWDFPADTPYFKVTGG